MKFILSSLLILLILLTNLSIAGEFTDFSRVHFQNANLWVSAKRTCVEDSFLFHKNKNFVEKLTCTGRDSSNCKVFKRVELIEPLETVFVKCGAFSRNCVSDSLNDFLKSPRVKVFKFKNRKSFKNGDEPVAFDWYKIPRCN